MTTKTKDYQDGRDSVAKGISGPSKDLTPEQIKSFAAGRAHELQKQSEDKNKQ